MEGLKKALVVGGLMTILAGNVIGGSLSQHFYSALRNKQASPTQHFNVDNRFGYISKMKIIKPNNYSKVYNMNKTIVSYDSSKPNNPEFEKLISSLHEKMFSKPAFESPDTKIRVRIIPNYKWQQGTNHAITIPSVINEQVHYDIKAKQGPTFRLAGTIMHELCHVRCRNPSRRYDEMYAIRGEYAALRLMAGNNPFLNRYADAIAHLRSQETTLHGDVWRESEQIIARELGIKPVKQHFIVTDKGIFYKKGIKKARKDSHKASVWLCNVLNDSYRFKKIIK